MPPSFTWTAQAEVVWVGSYEPWKCLGGAVEGEKGSADWRMFKRDSLASSTTLMLRVTRFSTRAGPLW